MCKVYDAIYELSEHTESDILICNIGHSKIEGKLYKCFEEFGQKECYKGIITLKDARVKCLYTNEEKMFKWINIPTKHICAFAFKCCEM